MRTASLKRQPATDDGTFGIFLLDDGWECVSGELPERENQPGLSCIPPLVYLCRWDWSPKHQAYCYHLIDVPERSDIEIHAANFCGDRQMGKRCDLLGCIALGLSLGELDGQQAVLQSRDALKEFHKRLDQVPFQLTIA